jgi:hypothetical protein
MIIVLKHFGQGKASVITFHLCEIKYQFLLGADEITFNERLL